MTQRSPNCCRSRTETWTIPGRDLRGQGVDPVAVRPADLPRSFRFSEVPDQPRLVDRLGALGWSGKRERPSRAAQLKATGVAEMIRPPDSPEGVSRRRSVRLFRLSCAGTQKQPSFSESVVAEVEHVRQRARIRVKRIAADQALIPTVLDEAQDQGLIGQRVIDEVRLRVRRDHPQRVARS